MARVTTTILIFMVLMNGAVGIMSGSGLSDDLGVELAPGVSENIDDAIEHAKSGFSPDSGALETLFGLFTAGMSFFKAFISTTYAAPQMFMNLGFPSWFVMPIFFPLYIISALELVYAATGRELT